MQCSNPPGSQTLFVLEPGNWTPNGDEACATWQQTPVRDRLRLLVWRAPVVSRETMRPVRSVIGALRTSGDLEEGAVLVRADGSRPF